MAQNNFMMSKNLDSKDPEYPTLTQKYLPLYRKVSGFKRPLPERSISEDQQTILAKLDQFSSFIDDRMTIHQRELFSVMTIQVKRLLRHLHAMICNYNKMISQKNLSQDLWETRNEVEYFKYQSLRLYKQNSILKKKLANYEEEFRKFQFQGSCKDSALKKMAHRLAKSKAKNKANQEHSRRHKSVVIDEIGRSHRTQQDNETDCNSIPHKLQTKLMKIDKKYSENGKLHLKTQGEESPKIVNPESFKHQSELTKYFISSPSCFGGAGVGKVKFLLKVSDSVVSTDDERHGQFRLMFE